MSSIATANQILVLDSGKVAGLGTHEELLTSSKEYQEIVASRRRIPMQTKNSFWCLLVLSRIYYAIQKVIGALILNSQWFSTVLMTYYIGKSVDTMVGKDKSMLRNSSKF